MNRVSFVPAITYVSALAFGSIAMASGEAGHAVPESVIVEQREALAAATLGKGFGPQSPRDLGSASGDNRRAFGEAPPYTEMNLCDIHFHESAEHKGGEFTTHAGNGDGNGYGTGYKYDGQLSSSELAPIDVEIGSTEHGDLVPGDTIEIHYVYSTAKADPGPTLDTCFSDAIKNPQLRVESVVVVLVNDPEAADFTKMAEVAKPGDFYQAPGLPNDLGPPIVYEGSTTGPGYNETGSPLQVTWSVRPKVSKVDIRSVAAWLADNPFNEDHAHGVRNLIINPDLLSQISPVAN